MMDRTGRYDLDAIRAADTLRWLENSGPRYFDQPVIFYRMAGGFAEVLPKEGTKPIKLAPNQISYAAWYSCQQAEPGDHLNLKIRSK